MSRWTKIFIKELQKRLGFCLFTTCMNSLVGKRIDVPIRKKHNSAYSKKKIFLLGLDCYVAALVYCGAG